MRLVLHTFHEPWTVRLARLRRQVVEHPDGPTWLWRIRIRILEFLLSRHGDAPAAPGTDQPVDQPLVSTEADAVAPRETMDTAGDLSQTTLSCAARMVHQWFDVTHPPRSRAAMSPILDEIEDVLDEVRMSRGTPAPGAAWEWWCATWARKDR